MARCAARRSSGRASIIRRSSTPPEPNLNLLRRIAETGGGKMLDPTAPTVNPFLHDRQKTFQPRDLWEWLLKFAIILFTLDVGVRRIQIDHDEWLRAARCAALALLLARRAAPPEAEESLTALLARREQVRSQHTAPAPEARAGSVPPGATRPLSRCRAKKAVAAPASQTSAPPAEAPKPADESAPSTASRLLEAKRRAQKRRG